MPFIRFISIFFLGILFFNGSEGKSSLKSKSYSSEEEKVFSYAYHSLLEHFHFDSQLESKEIDRIQLSIDSKTNRQIFTIDFQVKSSNNELYRCPMSIYHDPSRNILALLRSIVCLHIPFNHLKKNSNSISYPIELGDSIIIEETFGLDREETNSYDQDLFSTFEQIHQKIYPNDIERQKKYQIFKENLNRIEQLNNEEEGTAIYGITSFADLTENEFQNLYLNERLQYALNGKHAFSLSNNPLKVSPPAFDWRNLSAVTPVKNQGQCGSCWAFSVTGNIEGVWKIHSGELVSLSEQELIDCDKVDQGCNGGFMTDALEQIIAMNGLMTEEDYKYEGKQHQQCRLDQTKIKVKISSYLNISSDENEMAEWLAQNGPISIGLNANMMQFYFRGVAHPRRSFCNPQGLNHGVLLVGYGIEQKRSKEIPYWIIKNSWGPHWGEQGYYRLYRGDGSCGVNLMCSSAIIDSN